MQTEILSGAPLWIHFLAGAAFLTVLRLLPIWLVPDYMPGDIRAMRLFIRRERHQQGDLLRHGYNHPILFPLLISRTGIPFRILHIVVPTLADIITLGALVATLSWLKQLGIVTPAGAIAVIYLFVFYPASIIVYIGPRSYGLSERITMEAIYTIAVLLLLLSETIFAHVIAGMLLVYLVLASRFSVQVIILVLLPALLVQRDWDGLGILVLAFLVALIMPGMHYLERLKHHWAHLMHFRRYIGDRRYLVGNRNMLPSCRNLSLGKCMKRWFKFLTRTNAYSAGLLWHFPVIFAALSHIAGNTPEFLHGLAALVLWAVIAWLLTGFSIFKIAGIAERYLAFNLVPALVILAVNVGAAVEQLLLVYIPAALLLLPITIHNLHTLTHRQRQNEKQVAQLADWLNDQPQDLRVAAALPTPYLWLLLERLWDRFSWYDIFFHGKWDEKTVLHRYPKCSYLKAGGYELFVTLPEIHRELVEYDPCYRKVLTDKKQVGDFVVYRVRAQPKIEVE